jgi:hypothetical protein
MDQNPYDTEPYAPELAQAWGEGFLYGLTGPLYSDDTLPDIVPGDHVDAFNEGRLVGQQEAISGITIAPDCIDTEEHHLIPGGVWTEIGVEVADVVYTSIFHAAKIGSAAFSAGFMTMLDIALAAHTYTDPALAAERVTTDFVRRLQDLGREDCDFYIGGAIDYESPGCQLQLSPLYREQSQAKEWALGAGRAIWFVGRWRGNQCSTLSVVDGATE